MLDALRHVAPNGVVAGGAATVLMLVALMAAAGPVRRAARVDPASALRAGRLRTAHAADVSAAFQPR
jgi:hypothetical protein